MADKIKATVLGFPRIGRDRTLKRLTEDYWAGRIDADALLAGAAHLRRENWRVLTEAGVDEVPVNDFSFYDQVLDTAAMVGAVPQRHRTDDGAGPAAPVTLDTYFAMARGSETAQPLEMTKWFDTNYHYLVPELGPDDVFRLDAAKVLGELDEARIAGVTARPVVVGPLTFLLLAKPAPGVAEDFDPLELLPRLLPVYEELLGALATAGAEWVQLDEPALVLDQPPAVLAAAGDAYQRLGSLPARPKLLVASYFDTLGPALAVLRGTPVDGLALDLTGPAAGNLELLAAAGGLPGKRLVAGVVDGRNIWVNDLRASLATLGTTLGLAGEVVVGTSSSLLHVPLDVADERTLDPAISRWFAFAKQKAQEVVALARGLSEGADTIRGDLERNEAVLASRATSPITRDPDVRARVDAVAADDGRRAAPYPERAAAQQTRLKLPDLPTTTIGSFPQTAGVRGARAQRRRGEITEATYANRMRAEIEHVVSLQERLGLDVLVHGEPERNDMVQYFAEQLTGYVATQHGWVQSYGTRYVRPPVLVGDVSRPEPMTVEWTRFAQSLTERPVKGMLTGPVTMLAWSFVRDDQPVADTAVQVALALRDEVTDLEAAGTAVIQVDEPALRETLPLREAGRPAYLAWATRAFRLATGAVRADTQVHTHMCYAEFGDVLEAIIDLDADVISMEAARSHMEIAGDLAAASYPSGVGPGVYDIHSPRVPSAAEIGGLLRAATDRLPRERIWVNPDCGLKTRTEPEIVSALANLVEAAEALR